MLRRRGRFHELIERQLELFAREHADLLHELDEAERAYDRSSRESAEERYGDYVDAADAARDALEEIRTAYAVTLEDDTAAEYELAFARAARKRYPGFPLV